MSEGDAKEKHLHGPRCGKQGFCSESATDQERTRSHTSQRYMRYHSKKLKSVSMIQIDGGHHKFFNLLLVLFFIDFYVGLSFKIIGVHKK